MFETKHAQDRSQQRSIPPLIKEWLIEYGARTRGPHKAIVCHFDRTSRRRLSASVGKEVVKRLGGMLDTYLVLSNDEQTLITAGHRSKRIRRLD